MTKIRRKASLYVRLSKEAKVSNLSLDGMLTDVRVLADRLDYDARFIHVDDGRTGAVRDRPEFRSWLDDGRSGRVDALLTFHADRLTREGVNAAAMILDVVEGKDPSSGRVVRDPVHFADCHGIDSMQDPDGYRWRFVIAAEVARAERERMRQRSRDARQRMDQAGRYHGGIVPFGLRVVEDEDGNKTLDVDPAEARLLHAAADRLMSGDSVRAVTRWLNAQGSKTRRGFDWQRSSVRSAMLSDAGRRVLGASKGTTIAKRLHNPADDPEHRPERRPGRPARHLLVGGLGVCASCGGNLVFHSDGYYFCARRASAQPCPKPVWIKATDVDDYLALVFLDRYGDEHPIIRQTSQNFDLDAAQDDYDAALARFVSDPTDESALAEFRRATDALAAEKTRPPATRELLVPSHETYADRWRGDDVTERRRLLGKMLDAPVRVLPDPERGRHSHRGVDLSRVILSPSDAEFWAEVERREDVTEL